MPPGWEISFAVLYGYPFFQNYAILKQYLNCRAGNAMKWDWDIRRRAPKCIGSVAGSWDRFDAMDQPMARWPEALKTQNRNRPGKGQKGIRKEEV